MCSYIEAKVPPAGRSYHCGCHNITSPDGFVLQTARILPQKSSDPKGVAFLMHGFLMTGMDWVVQPDTSSNLAYMLSDAGFDVWIGNNRGNVYSAANSKMDINGQAYWDAVDFDQMAIQDVPSIMDYVLAATQAPRLHWVGHSLGGGTLVHALAKNPSLVERLGSSVLLAPGVNVAHLQVYLLKYMGLYHIDEVWRNFGFDIPTIATNKRYFGGPGVQKILEFFAAETPLCRESVAFCNDVLKLIGVSVGDPKNLDWRTMADAAAYDPGASSFHLLQHWAQRVRKDTLRMFDWGAQKNQQHYNGSSVPPLYDLSKITGAHLALFDGDKDLFMTSKDMTSLVSEVPKENWIKRTTMHDYAHMDFAWGKDAHVRLYPEIISLLSANIDVASSTLIV